MSVYEQQLVILSSMTQVMLIAIMSILVAMIFWKMIIGEINLRGLLIDKTTKENSPGRLQLLLLTFIVAGTYLDKVLSLESFNMLPNPPDWALSLIGGSSVLYLGGKSAPVLGRTLSSLFK